MSAADTPLPNLFSPLKIGRMEVANRIMMPGMGAGVMLDEHGAPNDDMLAYFVERAKARPGLMAIGASDVVPPEEVGATPLVQIYDDRAVPGLKRLVDAVHQYPVKFGIQISNDGVQAAGRVKLSPSGIGPNAVPIGDLTHGAPVIKALSRDEIQEVIGHFAAGARRCYEAGFDFVEIHGGHGYLISAFLSPFFNRREDEYGGPLENRARFLLDILKAVKAEVGDKMGVGVKYNGNDFQLEHGWGMDEAIRIAPWLEAAGADYLSITAGVMGAQRLTIPPLYEKQGCYSDMAAEVKKHVKIPVAAIGRIKHPQMGEALVADGQADIICMGRAMIADSGIVDKARRGDFKDIRNCLADCRGCIDEAMRSIRRGEMGNVSCVVNPRMQRERVCIDIEGSAKDAPKRVLVVGGGLAGLEAARRTAFSGHKVTLCESRGWLGGQIRLAAMIPGRQEIADMLPWYDHQLEKHGVEIRLNTTVDAALIDEIAPDVVVVATGSVPQIPQDMVESVTRAENIELLLIDDILEEGLAFGRNILVVGGDQMGMLAADYLSEGGAQVTIAEARGSFGQKLAANDRWYLTSRIIEKKVKRLKKVTGVQIAQGDSVILSTPQGEELLPDIDTVVFASERYSNRGVAEIAKNKGLETYIIGDAYDASSEDAGTIFANIHQAYDVARRI